MSSKSGNKVRRKYDAAFKADVLKMVESGRSIPDVSQSLGINENVIYRWRNKAKEAHGELDASSEVDNQADEIRRLKAQLHRTEQERDILKKALGIFSRGI